MHGKGKNEITALSVSISSFFLFLSLWTTSLQSTVASVALFVLTVRCLF